VQFLLIMKKKKKKKLISSRHGLHYEIEIVLCSNNPFWKYFVLEQNAMSEAVGLADWFQFRYGSHSQIVRANNKQKK
jgi:hypothetical protein